MSQRILVAGVGNIFLGDDAFGVEVAQSLARKALSPDVEVIDFGISAIDLGYALQDSYRAAILVDTVQRGGAPGTLYLIEPGPDSQAGPGLEAQPGTVYDPSDMPSFSPHDLSPGSVLQFVRHTPGATREILLVGCEPESFGTELGGEGRMGLSEPVTLAVGKAVEAIESLLARASAQGASLRSALFDGSHAGGFE